MNEKRNAYIVLNLRELRSLVRVLANEVKGNKSRDAKAAACVVIDLEHTGPKALDGAEQVQFVRAIVAQTGRKIERL